MFARYLASLALAIVMLTPLRELLWMISRSVLPPGDGENLVLRLVVYSVTLVALYLLIAALAWIVRRVLVTIERWQPLGLGDLDHAVPGGAGRLAWPVLTLAAVAAAAFWGHDRARALIEAGALSGATALGLFGRIPGLPPLPGPDPVPEPPTPLPAPSPTPSVPDAGTRALRFEWFFTPDPTRLTHPPESHTIEVLASLARYHEFQSLPHDVHQVQDFVRFVRGGVSPEIEHTARALRDMTGERSYSRLAEINNVLAFAQSFPYVPDEVQGEKGEYPRYPLETLVDDGGDCEDHAILAAACLRRLGYDARLVDVDYGTRSGHMALAVQAPADMPQGFYIEDAGGRKYYYCEVTTDAGTRSERVVAFRLGDVPEPARGARLRLLEG